MLREPRARRSVACALWTGNATALIAYAIAREFFQGRPVPPAIGLAAVACAILAYVWKEA